ncbi:hypothetical protein GGS20DRAFT_129460 [Poronia punctata]|nr:hypothetical protein GGS20DRAFT_129460 [Poronia punctata]
MTLLLACRVHKVQIEGCMFHAHCALVPNCPWLAINCTVFAPATFKLLTCQPTVKQIQVRGHQPSTPLPSSSSSKIQLDIVCTVYKVPYHPPTHPLHYLQHWPSQTTVPRWPPHPSFGPACPLARSFCTPPIRPDRCCGSGQHKHPVIETEHQRSTISRPLLSPLHSFPPIPSFFISCFFAFPVHLHSPPINPSLTAACNQAFFNNPRRPFILGRSLHLRYHSVSGLIRGLGRIIIFNTAFHDPYSHSNDQLRPVESTRHTLNPTGARAREEESDDLNYQSEGSAASPIVRSSRPQLLSIHSNTAYRPR